eukprot:g61179.t1
MMPDDFAQRFYAYQGSLLTPACSDSVTWVVAATRPLVVAATRPLVSHTHLNTLLALKNRAGQRPSAEPTGPREPVAPATQPGRPAQGQETGQPVGQKRQLQALRTVLRSFKEPTRLPQLVNEVNVPAPASQKYSRPSETASDKATIIVTLVLASMGTTYLFILLFSYLSTPESYYRSKDAQHNPLPQPVHIMAYQPVHTMAPPVHIMASQPVHIMAC